MQKRTPREWAEKTIRDLKRRQYERLRGRDAAKEFLIESSVKKKKENSRLKKRGVRSF